MYKSDPGIAGRAKDKFWDHHPRDDLNLTNICIHSTEQTVSPKHVYSSPMSYKDSFTTYTYMQSY